MSVNLKDESTTVILDHGSQQAGQSSCWGAPLHYSERAMLKDAASLIQFSNLGYLITSVQDRMMPFFKSLEA